MATTLAIASPSLLGWNRASQLRDAGDHLMATIRYARTKSIATSQVYRLTVDTNAGAYQLTVQEGQNFVSLGTELGRQLIVPDDCRIELSGIDGKALNTIDFYPSGRTQPAKLKIWNQKTGDSLQIECASPAQEFKFVTDEAQKR